MNITVYDFCSWYWGAHGTPHGFIIVGSSLYIISYSIYFILTAWRGVPLYEFDTDDIPMNLIVAAIAILFCSAMVSLLWPLVIIILLLILIYQVINKWGENYEMIVKSQEEKKLTALAQLIKDDPEVMRTYEQFMKDLESKSKL